MVLVSTYGNYIAALLVRAERPEAEAALQSYERLLAELPLAHQTWRLPLVKAMFHALAGAFVQADACSQQARDCAYGGRARGR